MSREREMYEGGEIREVCWVGMRGGREGEGLGGNLTALKSRTDVCK